MGFQGVRREDSGLRTRGQLSIALSIVGFLRGFWCFAPGVSWARTTYSMTMNNRRKYHSIIMENSTYPPFRASKLGQNI
jgi:hypothetical protein